MNALDTAIYNVMKNNSALTSGTTAIGLRDVPEGTALGYITFFNVATNRDWSFDKTFTDALYQIDIWAATDTAAGTILDLLITALDWATLTITGYTGVYCRLENLQKMNDPEADVARIMTEWRVLAQS